jgi:UDP-glucose 4-epimerase
MRKTVLLTGGAGFIGSNVARHLIDRGYRVHVVDSLLTGKRTMVPKGAHFYRRDITNARNINALVKKLSPLHGLFHLAAIPRVPYSIEHPIESHLTNVDGTLTILRAAAKHSVRRVVFASSSAVYGDQKTMPLKESFPALPKSPYGLHKYIGERYMKLWYDLYRLPTVSLRYFNVYGPGLDPEGPYALVIGRFLKQRSMGTPLTITGDGTQTRDFTHVDDVALATIRALESPKVGKGEVINIGSGREVSIRTLAGQIGGPIVNVPARLEPKHGKADVSLAKKLLGWQAKISLEKGIEALKQEWHIA